MMHRPRRAAALVAGLALMFCAASVPVQAQVLIGRDNWLFYAEENIRDAGKPGIDASVALIRYAQEKLAARGTALVVVVAPAKARFYPDRLPAGHAVSAEALPRYAYIVSALASAGIASVDLMPVLKSVETGEQTAFLQKDSHWTAWGAEAAARGVADLIRSKWPMRGAAGGATPLGEWVKERRAGDFLQLMTAEQRKQVGQQIYVVRANKAGKAGLLADADTPVHIVGNSFVQPYLGFPQALSAALDRPVGLSWKYGNFGPWASFREYLESPEFRSERPQVVVWQFNEAQLLYGPNATGQWDAKSLMSDAAWRAGIAAATAR
jgi:alginate O-acetyltransferase complex protein AlgJ